MQFGVMVTGSRSKVTSTQIFCMTHLCSVIHPHTKYQPKIFICLGDTERKGILVSMLQGQGDTPLSPDTSPMQISRKNLAVLKSYRVDTKLLTATRPPYRMAAWRPENRSNCKNFSEIAPEVFSVVDRTHKHTDECKTVYPLISGSNI
jgi:hypothetical protein